MVFNIFISKCSLSFSTFINHNSIFTYIYVAVIPLHCDMVKPLFCNIESRDKKQTQVSNFEKLKFHKTELIPCDEFLILYHIFKANGSIYITVNIAVNWMVGNECVWPRYFIRIGHFVTSKHYEDVVSVISQGSSTSLITIAQDASSNTIDKVTMTHRIDDSPRRVGQQMWLIMRSQTILLITSQVVRILSNHISHTSG